MHGLRTDRDLVLRADHRRGAGAIHHDEGIGDVAGQPLVVLGRVERARKRIAFRVEAIKADHTLAAIGGVRGQPRSYGRVHRERLGRKRDTVLADLAEVEHQRGIALHLRLLRLHEREELDVFRT